MRSSTVPRYFGYVCPLRTPSGRSDVEPEQQLEALTSYVREHRGTLVDVVVADNGWSASSIARLVEEAKRGDFDVLVALDVAHLAESTGKAAWIERQLAKHHVRIEYVRALQSNPLLDAYARMTIDAVNEYEREQQQARARLARIARRK